MTPTEKVRPKAPVTTTRDRGMPPKPPVMAPTPAPKNFGQRDSAPSGARKRYAKGGSACGTKKMMGGGMTKGYAKGGVTRADGICMKGHTKGKMV